MSSVLAVIGGSGIYDLPGLQDVQTHEINTPYGTPSAPVVTGSLNGQRLAFLARHGVGHVLAPHEINSRANICALKKLGATSVVSLSAVGSMREDIAPGHVVIVDQYIDLTKHRRSTFFDDGIAAHVSFAEPVCPALADALGSAAEAAGAPKVHHGGTYVCMEGPQFSTRAESLLYRSWSVSVIGMTAMPEAKLAREAELPYATLAMATDYDCWHESEESVTVEAVLGVLRANAELAKRCVAEIATRLPDPAKSIAAGALRHAVITQPQSIAPSVRSRLDWLLGHTPT